MSAEGFYKSGTKVLVTSEKDPNKFYIARVSEDVKMELGGLAYMTIHLSPRDQKETGFEYVTINVNSWDVERIVA